MLSLADLQMRLKEAVVHGDATAIAPMLASPGDATKRLAIHSRHYAASLVSSILERFPATIWLLGSARVLEAARAFMGERPPSRPCIAEYGEEFPTYLSRRVQLPYVEQFATLEWHVGRLSIAIEQPAIADLSTRDPARIMDVTFRSQPSVEYLLLDWPVDELFSFYLRDASPDVYTLEPERIWLEIRGNRGSLRLNRLTPGAFTFRKTLMEGAALGDAATAALEADARFDPAQGLSALLQEGLVVAVGSSRGEGAA